VGAQTLDAIQLEVFRHLFTALAEEMGASLKRAAFSPNIKERRDYSCALFDPQARAVAMGDHMPVHLGAMPMSVSQALEALGDLAPGDVACLNDPFRGGTHLPDITFIAPVYESNMGKDDATHSETQRILGYVASRAHHSDVGGIRPGSMPLAEEIYQEGLRIPPLRLWQEGRRNDAVWDLIMANVRTPEERAGDLSAQLAALHTGAARLREIADKRSADLTLSAMDALVEYADRMLLEGLRLIPPGQYDGEDWLEDDGFGSGPIPIRVSLAASAQGLEVDFSGSGSQTRGGVNAVGAITSSATRYVVRVVVQALLDESLPAGGGSMKHVRIRLPEDSVVNASPPASVAAGNVETSQRITDVLLRAFAKALPDRMPALSQGTMNNMAMGGMDPRSGTPFTYYETVGGGMGAGPGGPGLSGVHTHMTNSLNTPIEALEHAYPFRVARYEIRRDSGGEGAPPAGSHRGGDGLRRDLELLANAEVTLLTERRTAGPVGMRGGEAGAPGENRRIRDGEEEILPGKVTFQAEPGDVISIRTPGGGGWGEPETDLDE
jgi:N-methylhydantoinase B